MHLHPPVRLRKLDYQPENAKLTQQLRHQLLQNLGIKKMDRISNQAVYKAVEKNQLILQIQGSYALSATHLEETQMTKLTNMCYMHPKNDMANEAEESHAHYTIHTSAN